MEISIIIAISEQRLPIMQIYQNEYYYAPEIHFIGYYSKYYWSPCRAIILVESDCI